MAEVESNALFSKLEKRHAELERENAELKTKLVQCENEKTILRGQLQEVKRKLEMYWG